jgi:hypothetical protein
MKPATSITLVAARIPIAATTLVMLCCLALLAPPASVAFHDEQGTDRSLYYYYQIEQDRIRSQEEVIREMGREKRRDELEQERKERAVEFEKYLQEKFDANRAASRAPQGAYYRRPGFTTDVLPPGSAKVTAGQETFFYHQGLFFAQSGKNFVVITAPVGSVVESVPEQALVVGNAKGETLLYYFGTFFATRGGRFEVVIPPRGAMVDYLPEGYEVLVAEGTTFFKFGDVTFKPYLFRGVLVYTVTAP